MVSLQALMALPKYHSKSMPNLRFQKPMLHTVVFLLFIMMFLISLLLSSKIVTAMSLMLLSMFPSSSIVTFVGFISNFLYASPCIARYNV